ncbi:hypothetical protein PROAA_2750003 [Candidatus Propionivibrio aalborgensis]|uniref:Uncharacterized protein n=1 Tax=Candidatus Propionivibrio aalborgensis TaxID=1860101 RepID=A0A1A8XUN4_9RHOO|nr:hypothetical protein PROAA_2750003 [Candidatus Propionivibrio aalborgensis]
MRYDVGFSGRIMGESSHLHIATPRRPLIYCSG